MLNLLFKLSHFSYSFIVCIYMYNYADISLYIQSGLSMFKTCKYMRKYNYIRFLICMACILLYMHVRALYYIIIIAFVHVCVTVRARLKMRIVVLRSCTRTSVLSVALIPLFVYTQLYCFILY